MLDMGFHEDIAHLLGRLPRQRQTLLFSATWPDGVTGIGRTLQKDPVEVRVAGADTADRIEQRFVLVTEERKTDVLLGLLDSHRPERALVFCNRRIAAQALCDELARRGMSARALHGDLEQRERDEAMILFANRSISYLVATDVAARGLDIDALPAVINHDLSPDPETHVHRIGRTGRAGSTGIAISLVTADEMHRVRGIEDYLGIEIDVDEPDASSGDGGPVQVPPTCTLRINAGKKDKIRPGDIVGALTAGDALRSDDIGKITVRATMSFVAVDAGRAEAALALLSDGRIKKRKVRARLVR